MKRLNVKIFALCTAVSLSFTSMAYAANEPLQSVGGQSSQMLSKVSTMAGSGMYDEADGSLDAAAFRNPKGIAIQGNGTIAVSDSQNHLIRTIDGSGVSVKAGIILEKDETGIPAGAYVDGTALQSVFSNPQGLDFDAQGNLYVADTDNHAIRKVSTAGVVSTVAGNGVLGLIDGSGEEARFYSPSDVAVAADGTLYVADTLNHVIRKIGTDGQVSTLNDPSDRAVQVVEGIAELAGDFKDGGLKEAKFNEPSSIVIDPKGNLIVSDSGNHRIRYIDLQANTVMTIAGGKGAVEYEPDALYAYGDYVNGPAADAKFDFPKGLALTDEGGLVIADSFNHAIRYLIDGQVYTLAGGLQAEKGFVDSIDVEARLFMPYDVAASGEHVYVADAYNNVIRHIELFQMPSGLSSDVIHVMLEDRLVAFDAEPEIHHNRTMVPVRAVTESLGYAVQYGENGTVTLTKSDTSFEMSVGQSAVTITSGSEVSTQTIDAAPYVKQGRTYVPLRFFSEAIGMDVQWHGPSKTAIIRSLDREAS